MSKIVIIIDLINFTLIFGNIVYCLQFNIRLGLESPLDKR
jgi:hypothetical protein